MPRRFFLILIIISGLTMTGCNDKQQMMETPGVPVTVGKVIQKTMPVQVEANGTIEAYNSVTIIPQVTGRIMKINFKEGQLVQAGALLAIIDPSSYAADLQAAEATIKKNESLAKFNEAEAQRYADLWQGQAISRSMYENYLTKAESQNAEMANAKAAAEVLRIKLDRCYIYAPINGVTGAYLADIGTLVTENNTKFVSIKQIDPIFVNFTVAEKDLDAIRYEIKQKGQLKVTATIPDGRGGEFSGKLSFIDNAVDVSTGTIRIKAEFQNSQNILWPGRYADVIVILSEQPNATVVPSVAVQQGQNGYYVFVVKDDNTVRLQSLEVDRRVEDETVVKSGLNPGETVITDGQLNLVDGAKVEIRQ